jgi:predicted flap endonuclease-1-like 5' DNA nuclease/peptidoglycan hydrolase CwlO-like protein
MPELTAIHIGLLVLTLVSGSVLGWLLRHNRATREKIAVNAGWHEQLESRQSEHDRLIEQSKGLMEQVSESQATHKETAERATELAQSLTESFSTRDQLQQQVKECQSSLEDATVQHAEMQTAYAACESRLQSTLRLVDKNVEKIAHLKSELGKWHSRLPPLVEKFRIRHQEATELESALEDARERIRELEEMDFSGQTRIEPLSAESLPDGLDASNDPHDDIEAEATPGLQDETVTAADNAGAAAAVDPYAELAHDEDGDAIGEHDLPGAAPEHEDARDDLKQIKGIGPAIAKTLNDLGICRFDQLAEMSEHEIDRVAQRLKGFRSRIYREDWLGQARDLQYQKNKNPS